MKKTKLYLADIRCLEESLLFEQLYQTASKYRQKKIDRLRFPDDKKRALGAAALLRYALAEEGIHDFEVFSGCHGKPYLAGETGLFFNLSHSKDKVLCAVSPREVGCDLEKIRDVKFDVSGRYFSKEEQAALSEAKTPAEKEELFFTLWTLKESFVKATGEGGNLPFSRFTVRIEAGNPLPLTYDGLTYYFTVSQPVDGYISALCGLSEELLTTDVMFVDLANLNKTKNFLPG